MEKHRVEDFDCKEQDSKEDTGKAFLMLSACSCREYEN